MGEDGPQTHRLSRRRLIGRRVGQAVYYVTVVAIAVAVTWQITQQVFFPVAPDAQTRVTSCEQGLRALLDGLEEAKLAAYRQDGDFDEEAALDRFRLAISPSWAQRDVIGDICQSPKQKRLLDAMDRLRYSEEHGVRKQAAELTALRRRVGEMAAEVLPRAAQPKGP